MRDLSPAEIDAFLRGQRIARIGCHGGGETYVVPVIYAYDEDAMYVVTTEGKKIDLMRANPSVCVEVDEYDTDGKGSWRSVIAQGTYEELEGDAVLSALQLLRNAFQRVSGRAAAPRERPADMVVFRIALGETTGRAQER
ncbi:MAG TPA: pyridoxamine 5'-phosphate oxidase family protein [Gaiellaceae bacterium]|nr:pyridoxamine 5'-phosphate oxidase family protein [Gaiellaceae bacterium]